jgi:hypothetical protein
VGFEPTNDLDGQWRFSRPAHSRHAGWTESIVRRTGGAPAEPYTPGTHSRRTHSPRQANLGQPGEKRMGRVGIEPMSLGLKVRPRPYRLVPGRAAKSLWEPPSRIRPVIWYRPVARRVAALVCRSVCSGDPRNPCAGAALGDYPPRRVRAEPPSFRTTRPGRRVYIGRDDDTLRRFTGLKSGSSSRYLPACPASTPDALTEFPSGDGREGRERVVPALPRFRSGATERRARSAGDPIPAGRL